MGKLETASLKDVLKCIKRTSQVMVPPMSGFDSGVHKIDHKNCIVVSTDPCINVPRKWFGWLLMNYAASDVAVFGAKTQYAAINLLAPPKTKKQVFKTVIQQACKAAGDLEATVITGHTGTYDGLSTLVGTCTAYGVIKQSELITPAGAKSGDYLVCVKPLGLETLINFALTKRKLAADLFGHDAAKSLRRQVKMQTCVNEALLLAETGGVSAMHDATEGGFVAALNEVADASKVGFTVDFAELPILPELRKLAEHFGLGWQQVLATSSTGTLLATVSPSHRTKVIKALSPLRLSVKVVGVFVEGKRRRIKLDGEEVDFPEVATDPYVGILG